MDLVIRNARVVDGTGAASEIVLRQKWTWSFEMRASWTARARPLHAADVAVKDGVIVSIGKFTGSAHREIDANGHVLAPGFIDIHTHYDPQICWDRLATPSIEHGVTTVVMGNCSLSLAPVKKEGRRKLVKMFEKIEDIKEPTFDAAVSFAWESFGEYLDFIRPGLGLNVGALVGHSALRFYVMGKESQERVATDDEIARMCALLEQAMEAGAMGLSISYVDIDEDSRPVPSRLADMREKIALCKAMAKSGRGVLQTVPYFIDIEQQLANIEELGDLSLASGVVCSIAPITYSPVAPENWKRSLAKLEEQQRRGAKVYGQSMPRSFDINMRLSETSFLLYGTPEWNALMQLPIAERIAAFADPAARRGTRGGGKRRLLPLLSILRVGDTYSAENKQFEGKPLFEAAQALGKSLPDAMLDIAVRDKLQTEFQAQGRDPRQSRRGDQNSRSSAHSCRRVGCGRAYLAVLRRGRHQRPDGAFRAQARHDEPRACGAEIDRRSRGGLGHRQSRQDPRRLCGRPRAVRSRHDRAPRGGVRLRFSRRSAPLYLPRRRNRCRRR
jgi:N-acyl-D-amino-acid deacylase